MADRPDFTRKPVPTAPAAGAGQQAGVAQPLRAGQVMKGKGTQALTPESMRQLQAVGWKDGDPVPRNLSAKVQELQNRLASDPLHPPVSPDHKLKMPNMVDITEMPPEYQQEISNFLAEAKVIAAQQLAEEAAAAEIASRVPAGAGMGVAEAIHTASAAAAAGPSAVVRVPSQLAAQTPEGSRVSQVENIAPVFTHTQAELRERASSEGADISGTSHKDYVMPTATDPSTLTNPPVIPTDSASVSSKNENAAGGTLPIRQCPRCHWDMKMVFEVEPTDVERRSFVAALLGNKRFTKIYSLFGGNLRARMRSLTSSESDLIYTQLRYDMATGKVQDDVQYFNQLQTYRLVMGCEKLYSENAVVAEVPEILTVPYTLPETGNETVLVPMTDWFWKEAVSQEPLRRVLMQKHREFQRLLEALEAQTSEASFWNGIE